MGEGQGVGEEQDVYDNLSIALSAVILLHRQGRHDLLMEIDPSGALVSGECSDVYAALMLQKYQMCQVQKHEGEHRNLNEVMADYRNGLIPTFGEAARQAGLSHDRFRVQFEMQYGKIPTRGFRATKALPSPEPPVAPVPPRPGNDTDTSIVHARDAYEMYKAGMLSLPDAARQAGVRRQTFEKELDFRGISRRTRGRPKEAALA